MIFKWPFVLRHVEGTSMSPALSPDQLVIGYATKKIKPGNLVIVRLGDIEIVKRVTKIDSNMFFVAGDNPAFSTDSRQFGWVKESDVLYKVIIPKLSSLLN